MPTLSRIVFRWPGGYGLEIQPIVSEIGPLLEEPLPINGYYSANMSTDESSLITPDLCFSADDEGLFEPLRLRENTEYYLGITVPGDFRSVEERWKTEQTVSAWPFVNPRLGTIVNIFPSQAWKEIEVDGVVCVTLIGRVNFQSFVGVVDLSLDRQRSLRIEVASSKLEYFNDFKALLRGVARDIVELLFQVDSVAGFRFERMELEGEVSPSVLLFHLRRLMDPDMLPAAIETILRHPHTRLITTSELIDPSQVSEIDLEQLAQFGEQLPYREGGPLEDLFHGASPTLIPQSRRTETSDTPENRYIKAFLFNLSNILRQLQILLFEEKKQASLREIQQWTTDVHDWLSWVGWREVGELTHIPSNSQVLQRREGYRDVYEADLLLRYGLCLPWDRGLEIADTIGDIRPIFELYEYWCYFALRNALRTLCGSETKNTSSFYLVRDNRLEINLRRGRSSKLDFVYTNDHIPVEVSLFYNRKFDLRQLEAGSISGSYSTEFRPDFSICIQTGSNTHWLHFDAKYRLNIREWERQLLASDISGLEKELGDDGNEDTPLYMKSDIYKMHTYRDALLGSRGAYVLFPASGRHSKIFIRHTEQEYRQRYQIPGIGAFALRPDSEKEQLSEIVEFLRRIIHSLISQSGYQEEMGLVDD